MRTRALTKRGSDVDLERGGQRDLHPIADRDRIEEPPRRDDSLVYDADRQAIREAERPHAELLRVYEELVWKYAPPRMMTDEERAEAIARFPMMSRMSTLKIGPSRRS